MFRVTEIKGSSDSVYFWNDFSSRWKYEGKKIFISLIIIAFLLSTGDLTKGTELGFHKQYQSQESRLRGFMVCEDRCSDTEN